MMNNPMAAMSPGFQKVAKVEFNEKMNGVERKREGFDSGIDYGQTFMDEEQRKSSSRNPFRA